MVLNWIDQKKAKPVIDKLLQQIELPVILKQQQIRKVEEQVDELIKRGLRLLRGNMLDQASKELLSAYERLPDYFVEEIEPTLNEYLQKEDYEKSLLIGLIVLKIRTDDYRLANTIGNCARKLKRFKQANNLYRLSLRANREYNQAFYNFAASLGRVDKYDLEIQTVVEKYLYSEHFFLPGTLPEPGTIDELEDSLTYQNKMQQVEEVQKLIKEEYDLEQKGDFTAADKVETKIIERQKRSNKPSYQQMCKILMSQAKKAEKDFASSESELENVKWQYQIYNLGLLALKNDDILLAKKSFRELKDEQSKLPYVKMLNALVDELNGKRDEAIADLSELLKENSKDRFVNINLGLLFHRADNRLLTYKYLLLGGFLLERSEGLFSLDEIFLLAEESLRQGALNRSLGLFQLIVEESDNVAAWGRIGDIYWQMLEKDEAIRAYKKILTIDPDSKLGYDKLRVIHDAFCQKAMDFTENRMYNPAVREYDKALNVLRVTETLKLASEAYRVIQKRAISLNLQMEYQEAVVKENRERQEIIRLQLITKGKEHMKLKKIQSAISHLEKAFDMKADKEVLTILVHVYKSLKRREALNHLLKRWQKMIKHDIKLKRFVINLDNPSP
ncbi:MAG: hypothetical protein GY786_11880 [Proteobacteria bacterium]|nr:hypothetical protein [Pseudomonadota bacterium]